MKKYMYVTQDFQGTEISAESLYGIAGLRTLIMNKGRYYYDRQMVYRYVGGEIDTKWLRRVQLSKDGIFFSRM